MWRKKIAAVAATVTLALLVSMSGQEPQKVSAQEPRVIDVTAKRFAFAPSSITVKI